jgi:Na+/melibiose symporter-like transporter
MRRLLRHPNARIYLLGQGLSIFGDTSLWLAAGIWVKTLTGSNAAAGLVFFAFGLPSLLSPLAGMLVDRVRRRPLLIWTNLVTAAVVLLLLLVRGRADIWLIYTVMLAYGASYAVLGSAQSALLKVMLPDDLLADANGILQTIRQGLRLVSPLAGAGLFAWKGAGFVAVLDAGTFVVATITLTVISVAEPRPIRSEQHWKQELSAGVRHILHIPALRRVVMATALVVISYGFSESIIFAVVDRGLGRDPAFLGVIMAVQGIGGLAGGFTASALIRRIGETRTAVIAMTLVALGLPLMALPLLGAVLPGVVLFGLSLPWLVVALSTLLQRLTPAELQGRAYSAVDALIGPPQILAIAIGAALVDVVDYRALLAGMALTAALAAAFLARRDAGAGRASASHA